MGLRLPEGGAGRGRELSILWRCLSSNLRRAGAYDITLRFAEVKKPGTISFALGKSTGQKEVPAGATAATFNQVRLAPGAGRLESWVTQDEGRIGMLDVTVTHVR